MYKVLKHCVFYESPNNAKASQDKEAETGCLDSFSSLVFTALTIHIIGTSIVIAFDGGECGCHQYHTHQKDGES